MQLYTKNGHPLQVFGCIVHNVSGKPIGQIRGEKVYGVDGKYIGTISNDRLVYRAADSAGIGTSFAAAYRGACARANLGASGVWGDEPDIPD